MALTKYKLGQLICQRREKYDGASNLPIRGVSREGFIGAKQLGADTSLYNTFYYKDFVFNPARMEINSIALNLEWEKAICSSLYEIFYVTDENIVLPEYLNLFIKRDEFARQCEFIGWGSAREYCRVGDISDIEIELPPLSIQQKYVDVYKSMLSNQQSYERGLDDLKLTFDAQIEKYKHNAPRKQLGDLVTESDLRNVDGSITTVYGVNKDKIFMPSVASGDDLTKYKVVDKDFFACNLMHVGRDVAVPMALNSGEDKIIVSPAYTVFQVTNTDALSEYILMWFSRTETDRYAWFMCDTNVRSGMEKKRLLEIDIPVPPLNEQNAAVEIFKSYSMRRAINEKLKAQIKDLCPILIKGSIEEARKEA